MTALSQDLLRHSKRRNVSPMCGETIDIHWPSIWDLFRELPQWTVLYDEAWTYQHCKMGLLQVWSFSDTEFRGMMVTRINKFPKCDVLEVVGLSGMSGIEFMDDLDSVCENLARQQKCTFLVASCRPGMERMLKKRHRGERMYSVLSRPVGLLRRS